MEGILLTNHAESLIALQRWDEADRNLTTALAIGREGDDPARAGEALKYLGILERERGRADMATRHLNDAHMIARTVGNPLLAAEVLRERGELLSREGNPVAAVNDWRQALHGFERLDATLDADDLRTRLAVLVQTPRVPDSK